MNKLLLDNISLIAGETIKFFILVVTGIVLLDRVKNLTRRLNTRVDALEQWRDEHISNIELEFEPRRPQRPLRGFTLWSSRSLRFSCFSLAKQIPRKDGTPEWIDYLMNYGTKLTRLIAEAEARGDARTVDSLLRKKNQVNRWKRDITYVGR
jgi:hypothetical protein